MKILFLIPKLYHGGAENVVARLASALSERHEVHIALTTHDPHPYGRYYTDSRVTLHQVVAFPPLKRPFRTIIYTIVRINWLKQLKKQIGCDVSISFLSGENFTNVCSEVGVPTIVSVRNMMSEAKYSSRLAKLLDYTFIRYAGWRASAIVAVSRNVGIDQALYFHAPMNKMHTIYNPLDWKKINSQSKNPTNDETFDAFRNRHQHLLINVGRMVPQKAQWQLIRTLRDVLKEHPSTGLAIFGVGPLEEKLRELIKENHLEDHVYLAGYKNEPFEYIGKGDIFVMSSKFEGFSNAMLEAMACELPVISTDGLSGPRELLAPETDSTYQTHIIEYAPFGILTPPLSCNPDLCTEPCETEELLLSQAIRQLISDPNMQEHYRKQGLLRIQDFSPEYIVSQWEALCQSLKTVS